MNYYFHILIKLTLCIFLVEANPTWAEVNNRNTPVVKAVKKIGSSVVNINTEEVAPARRNPFRDLRNPFFEQFFKELIPRLNNNRRSLGSGVIIHPDGYILTNEVLRWLEKNTQAKQGNVIRLPKKIVSPSIASETFIKLLDETLALSPGLANYAILVQDISEETTSNLLLIFVEAGEAFQDILTQHISEAFTLSNLQGVTLDIIFAKPDEELIKAAEEVQFLQALSDIATKGC